MTASNAPGDPRGDVTGLRAVVVELVAASTALEDAACRLGADRRASEYWSGDGADADMRRRAHLAGVARELAVHGRGLAEATGHAADELAEVGAQASAVLALHPAGGTVLPPYPGGAATLPPTLPPALPPTPSSLDVVDGVLDAVADRRISAIDDRLAEAIDATSPARGAMPGGPRGPEPATVASWWAGLDGAERDRLARERPELVGGLDGLPADVRDRANRRVLVAARAATEIEARAGLPVPLVGRLLGLELPRAGVRDRLARLTALEAAVAAPDRQLLALETGGEADPGAVRAAVAAGNVESATHVGVFTPGFTADARHLPTRLGELDTVRAAAGPGAATVAWYGYDAPQWSGIASRRSSVLSTEPARVGGARLARFLDGLDAARAEPAHLTAVGHSYGSLTTAQALGPDGATGVDDVVHLGSPGVGPAPGAQPGHAWVVEAGGDPVADAGWFGPDPNRMDGTTGLSAREVVLPDGRVLAGSEGHNGYLQPGTTSAHNVAAVIGGRPDDVILDRGVGAGDRLRRLLE